MSARLQAGALAAGSHGFEPVADPQYAFCTDRHVQRATGRLFEVTPEHEIVWEYVSPFNLIDPRFGPTPAIFRAHRYPAETLAGRDLAPGRFEELEQRIEAGLTVGDE